MTEFLLGFAIGGAVAVGGTLVTIFGIMYLNMRKMRIHLIKESEKKNPKIIIDPETAEAVQEAELLLQRE